MTNSLLCKWLQSWAVKSQTDAWECGKYKANRSAKYLCMQGNLSFLLAQKPRQKHTKILRKKLVKCKLIKSLSDFPPHMDFLFDFKTLSQFCVVIRWSRTRWLWVHSRFRAFFACLAQILDLFPYAISQRIWMIFHMAKAGQRRSQITPTILSVEIADRRKWTSEREKNEGAQRKSFTFHIPQRQQYIYHPNHLNVIIYISSHLFNIFGQMKNERWKYVVCECVVYTRIGYGYITCVCNRSKWRTKRTSKEKNVEHNNFFIAFNILPLGLCAAASSFLVFSFGYRFRWCYFLLAPLSLTLLGCFMAKLLLHTTQTYHFFRAEVYETETYGLWFFLYTYLPHVINMMCVLFVSFCIFFSIFWSECLLLDSHKQNGICCAIMLWEQKALNQVLCAACNLEFHIAMRRRLRWWKMYYRLTSHQTLCTRLSNRQLFHFRDTIAKRTDFVFVSFVWRIYGIAQKHLEIFY